MKKTTERWSMKKSAEECLDAARDLRESLLKNENQMRNLDHSVQIVSKHLISALMAGNFCSAPISMREIGRRTDLSVTYLSLVASGKSSCSWSAYRKLAALAESVASGCADK